MRFSKEKELSIIEDYLQGYSQVDIAKKWNTFNTSIRRVLLRYYIPIRSLRDLQATKIPNPFELGDEKSEYFLGLLLTDGCIYKNKKYQSYAITLALKDKEIVEQFKQFFCPCNKISVVKDKRCNTIMYSTGGKSYETAQWLQQHGNFINKSYECDIYTPLTPHILRGIFDGDGYWCEKNHGRTRVWGVCGKSLIFLQKIQQYLESLEIKSYLSRRKKDHGKNYLYYLEIYKTIDVLKVANLMYSEASIYLLRKYDHWHLFEETLREKCDKFKEGKASPNPEPSLRKQFTKEGAETIIRYLNSNKITT